MAAALEHLFATGLFSVFKRRIYVGKSAATDSPKSIVDSGVEDLRIVMMGKTGSGKSASANTILGRKGFKASLSQTSVTRISKKERSEIDGRRLAVVDTPGLFDSTMSNDQVRQEMGKCMIHLAPGPHVFLVVLQLGRLTPEEKQTVELIKKAFGEGAEKFIIILLTHGDNLEDEDLTIEEYIRDKCDAAFKKFLSECGGRYHMFNNRKEDRTQVKELLQKIDEMVMENGGDCYTTNMFQKAEEAIKKEEERVRKEGEETIRREREEIAKTFRKEQEEMKRQFEREREETMKLVTNIEDKMKAEQELREREEQMRREQEERNQREMRELERKHEEEVRKRAEENVAKKNCWQLLGEGIVGFFTGNWW